MSEEDLLFSALHLEEDGEGEAARSVCADCERPSRVCWCPFLASPRVEVRSRVIILQHPKEEKRGVRTALMAVRGIAGERCTVRRRRWLRIGTQLHGLL